MTCERKKRIPYSLMTNKFIKRSPKMKKVFNKKSAIACLIAAAILVLGGSLAYFTDYAVTSAEGTAGTVAIALDSKINLLNEDGMDILNPGDQRDAGYDVTNMGNKSIDVRETVALKVLDREGNAINFTGSADTQSEFDLYLRSDVSEVPGEGYKPNADAEPLQIKEINGNVITYTLPEYSLNGNSDEYDEVETIDGVDTFVKENDFVLVFKGETGNDWQGVSLEMDVIVEAKQHENTGAGWEIVAQKEVTQGSITKDVVEEEIIITPLETVPSEPEDPEVPEEEPVVNDIFIKFDTMMCEDDAYQYSGDITVLVQFEDGEEYVEKEIVASQDENGYYGFSSSMIPNGEVTFQPINVGPGYNANFVIIDGPGMYTVDMWYT